MKKRNLILFTLLFVWIIAALWGYTVYNEIQKTPAADERGDEDNQDGNENWTEKENSEDEGVDEYELSIDGNALLRNSEVVFDLWDERIFSWFQDESQLCDEFNRTSSEQREMFCSDRDFFKTQVRFRTAELSRDASTLGFTLESDTLEPDSVVAIYDISRDELIFLTNYYLGNEFLSFSPSGEHFVYQWFCFEAKCWLIVWETSSLEDIREINMPEYIDMRQLDATFISWSDQRKIEFMLWDETVTEAF